MKNNILFILLIFLSFFMVFSCEDIFTSKDKSEYDNKSKDETISEIEKAKKYKNIDEVINDVNKLLSEVQYSEKIVEQAVFQGEVIVDVLPDISNFEIVTGSQHKNPNKVQVEIFASTEKSSPQKPEDRWLVDVADDFNSANIKLSNGKSIEIQVRRIASGTGHEFIKSRKYIPDAYTPSNSLWVRMIEASGIKTELVTDSLVPNYAGLVITLETEKLLKDTYGEVSFKAVVDAVVKKKISAAYTNPKASSTGLNMLYTILLELAEGDVTKIFSDKIVHSFEVFQEKVPLIATTTLHLRDLFEQGGKLDAFPTEYQTYQRMTDKTKLKFVPFGVIHSNPLYAMSDKMTSEKKEALEKFSQFAKSSKYKKLAADYGFEEINYKGATEPDGKTLLNAQKIWKEHKDSGKTVYAYFLTDTSGSMAEQDAVTYKSKINQLKIALEQASKLINETNYIGLMEFNSAVYNRLDLAPIDIIHRGKFITAVKSLSAGGGTAMYDGITAALYKLLEMRKKDPNGKYYLFVLTDGETNEGYEYDNLLDVMVGSKIKIYPIAYGDVGQSELQKLAKIGETGLIIGNPENIVNKLMTLFDLSL